MSTVPKTQGSLAAAIATAVDARMRHVNENRERLLEAWIAETGLHPSESVLCISDSFEGGKLVTRCWVERRKDGG